MYSQRLSRLASMYTSLSYDEYNIGDILFTEFGYDAVLHNFYQIVDLTGTKTLIVQQVGSTLVSMSDNADANMGGGKEKPNTSRKIGQPFQVRIGRTGTLRIEKNPAFKWDGKPLSFYNAH